MRLPAWFDGDLMGRRLRKLDGAENFLDPSASSDANAPVAGGLKEEAYGGTEAAL